MECTSCGYKLLGREFAKQGLQTFGQSLLGSTFSFYCLLSPSSFLKEFVDLGAFSDLSVGAHNFQTS